MRRELAILMVLCCTVGSPAHAGSARPIDIPALQAQVFQSLEAIAANPAVTTAIQTQNDHYQAMTDGEIDAVRAVWHGERLIKDRPLITAVMQGPPAESLKKVAAKGPLYVTDMRGLIVAASEMPQDYRLTPEALWEQAFLIGPHRLIITPSARGDTAPMWVSVAVTDPASKAVIGVVSTLMTVPRLPSAEDEESDEFEVRRPQELVYGTDPLDPVARVDKHPRVTSEARRVAGN